MESLIRVDILKMFLIELKRRISQTQSTNQLDYVCQ